MKQIQNPYPKANGFGLRVHRAEMALRKLALNPQAKIHTRSFDDCFEMGDGHAAVWSIMHKAMNEPDAFGQSLLTEGIQRMFGGSLNGQRYPKLWLEVYKSYCFQMQPPPAPRP